MTVILYAVLAGLTAGAVMGTISALGRRAGWVKADLVQVDGVFALRMLGQPVQITSIWIVGSLVHLFTSTVIGLVFGVLTWLGLPMLTWAGVAVFSLLMWLSMLFGALPVAGAGFLGSKLGRLAWLEHLLLEAIFGLVLGLMMGV
jgi:hypothetical protein